MQRYRKAQSVLLMITGVAIIVRGIHYSVAGGPGLSGVLQAAVIGLLVAALGFARWRYWRRR